MSFTTAMKDLIAKSIVVNPTTSTTPSSVAEPTIYTAPTTSVTPTSSYTAPTTSGLLTAQTPVSAMQATNTQLTAPNVYAAAQTPSAVNAVQDPTKGTVSGRMQELISANDPLQQQAITQAKQDMNRLGLLNSSMAVGAAREAQNRAALPIASADAESFNRFALTNADTANKLNMLNTEAANQASQFGAQQANAMNTTQATLSADTAKFNTQQQNAMVMNQLDQKNKVDLMDIQATYSGDVQASASSNALFNQTMAAIAEIQKSPDIPAANKQTNINQQIGLLKAGLNMNGSIAGLNLGNLLAFTV